MPALLSVAATTPQVEARQKTVTRRVGWLRLQPGTVLQLVDRNPRSGKPWRRLCLVQVEAVSREPLDSITTEDVTAEGFPGMDRDAFIDWYRTTYSLPHPSSIITRIQWRYLEGDTP